MAPKHRVEGVAWFVTLFKTDQNTPSDNLPLYPNKKSEVPTHVSISANVRLGRREAGAAGAGRTSLLPSGVGHGGICRSRCPFLPSRARGHGLSHEGTMPATRVPLPTAVPRG